MGIAPLTGEGGPGLRFAEGARVLVRRRDLDEARTLLDRAGQNARSDEELAAQAEAARGGEFGDGAVV